MLGIIPAAGSALRMQPLGGSKELLPLGSAAGENGRVGRLRVVSEYLLDRMLLAGADRLCLVVSSEKSDLLRYYAQSAHAARVFFALQPRPAGLCDAVFRALPFVRPGERVLIGLPDTVWYPEDCYVRAPRETAHLITFPVADPRDFDAVVPGESGRVFEVQVKCAVHPLRVWGAMTMPGSELQQLQQLWQRRGSRDPYLGDLFNAWIAEGGHLTYDENGTHYWDIGTPAGYERALRERIWEPPTALPDNPAMRAA